MSDPTIDDPQLAWGAFCELLEKGTVLARDDLGLTDLDRAEGLRYLGRLLQNGLLVPREPGAAPRRTPRRRRASCL